MTAKFSINKVCILTFTVVFITLSSAVAYLYILTKNAVVIFVGVLLVAFLFACIILFVKIVRYKLTRFSDALCIQLDNMMDGDVESFQVAEESLFYKINHRLSRLYEVMSESRRSIASERADLQELISDISHQVKTPIANLKMVNATLLEQPVPEEKQKEFLMACSGQLDKLDFLMQVLIKTSRLETGIFSLEKKKQPIYDTLASALGGILLNAENKRIDVSVNCPKNIDVTHDRKWTGEALFNILDNAVKYTSDGGSIKVDVETQEMYLKINISDTGKGITEQHQGTIFKRFYREEDVHDTQGIGIGLYLAREIITMQGGYIKVASKPQCGSTFSVYLPL